MYEYACTVRRVVDGDTLDLDIDLGLDILTRQRVRLNGLDAPEMSTPEGKAAKAYVEDWLRESIGFYNLSGFTVRTIKDKREKYGRYLALIEDTASGKALNADLVNSGHAKPYDGGKR